MKKICVLTAIFLVLFSTSAFAGKISTGESTSCNNAKSIGIEVDTIPNQAEADAFGYTSNDRGTANLVVFKSANFTTIPITLGPNDSNHTVMGSDHGKTGLAVRGSMGRNKFVLTEQSNFSRGDSIGDISGLVKITNTGTNPVTVSCN